MNAERNIIGLWWLPETPTNQWIGTLRLRPDKSPSLDVSVPKGLDAKMPEAPPLIHGCDKSNRPITLLFPSQDSATSSAVLTQASYSAGYAILGVDLASVDDFLVNTLTLNLQHLYNWAGISGFEKTTPRNNEIKIHYRTPLEQKFKVDEALDVEIRTSYASQQGQDTRITEDNHLTFSSPAGLTFTRCKDIIDATRFLLHLAILRPVYPISAVCTKNDYGLKHEDSFFPHGIELFSMINRTPVKSEIQNNRWVFKFSDVQTDFGAFVAHLLAFKANFAEALDCYFATIYHSLPTTIAHLCLTQGIEAYHGIKFQSHKEQDFKDKIRGLVERFHAQLDDLVKNPTEFAESVRDNRHYYTHHNPKWLANGKVVSGANLIRLNEKLKLIFQMCVLDDLGVSRDRFVRLRRQLASRIIEYT